MRKNGFILALAIIIAQFSVAAQDSVRTEFYEAVVYYRFDKSSLDIDYRNNRETLESIKETVQKVGAENIDALEVTAYTSPQGVYEHNLLLSKKRLADIRWHFINEYPELRDKMSFSSGGESWDKLREMIEADSKLSAEQKAAAFKVIDADVNQGTKKWRMEQLPFYAHIAQTHYTHLRSACAVLVKYHTPEAEEPDVAEPAQEPTVAEPEPVVTEPEPAVSEPEAIIPAEPEHAVEESDEPSAIAPVPAKNKSVIAALRTNLLFDAVSALNAGVEFPVGQRWSIAAEAYFPWWRIASKDITFQVLGGTVDGKYWFGDRSTREPLTGFYAGLSAGAGLYDLQWGDGFQGEFFYGGLCGGFAHSIARNLRLEYSLSVGALRSNFKEYEPAKGTKYGDIKVFLYPWAEKVFSGVIPTKAGVSLVWCFGKKEGGEQ